MLRSWFVLCGVVVLHLDRLVESSEKILREMARNGLFISHIPS